MRTTGTTNSFGDSGSHSNVNASILIEKSSLPLFSPFANGEIGGYT
jgi:hypothetical protein